MGSKSLACAALLFLTGTVSAGNTAAVLSSGGSAYLEAFSAFQAAYGAEVPFYDLSKGKADLPAGTRTVVAFGGKAAAYQYPPGIQLVYCMAPGAYIKTAPQRPKPVKISLLPVIGTIMATIRAIQPSLRTLKLFWVSPSYGHYTEEFRTEGARLGVTISALRLESSDDLPSALRQGIGGMDAFLVMPDPLLITPDTMMILREFSWANGIPFYGSTKGMAREGAVASVGVSFKDIGAAAAAAALRLEAGGDLPDVIFPEKIELTLNASAAKKCRVDFTSDIIGEAAYLFP